MSEKKSINLTQNARKVLKARYLKRDKEGNLVEDPKGMFDRVATNIAKANKQYGEEAKKDKKEFYDMMTDLDFLPNSPTLMNADNDLQQLSACFVLPVEDSMEGIFDSLKNSALIHKSGGGTGFSFSKLRPKDDIVKTTGGVASGPLSFMKIFDKATDIVKQGGKRRGANMGILRIDHPDIMDFITSKESEDKLNNFNISVAVTDEFMKAVKKDEFYDLVNPHNGKVSAKLNAREVFEKIVYMAHKNGEPGIIFLDEINRKNPTPHLGEIESTNPCVTADTLVSTKDGLMRIDTLYEKYKEKGFEIITDSRIPIVLPKAVNNSKPIFSTNINNKGTQLHKAVKIYNNGKKDVYRLTTKKGYEIKATADHKFLTDNGWKELHNLKKKDKVLIQSDEGSFSNSSKLPFEVNNTVKGKNGREYKFNFPQEWSEELGQILGFLIGDGWLKKEDKNCRVGFTFSKNDQNLLKYFKEILNQMYGKDIKPIKRKNNTYHLSYHSKFFVNYINKLGVKSTKSSSKEVPSSIYTATKEAVTGFLQGLFTADGTVSNDKNKGNYYVRLSSKSLTLLKQVQQLLINLGIKSRIYNRTRKPSNNKFKYTDVNGKKKSYKTDGILYELQISSGSLYTFAEEIGFLLERKQKELKDIINNHNLHQQKMLDEIKNIEYVGKETVYDLTEPVTHSFIGNGFVIHNCGEQPLLPYEACNLGSVNLSHMAKKVEESYKIDYNKLESTVRKAVRFLDNVIDMNKYPLEKIKEMVHGNRKIGLGVMGWSDLLIKLQIPYNSEEAVKLGEDVMAFIQEVSKSESANIAKKRGSFPNIEGSIYKKPMRNSTTTTIAPTGTISIIAGVSSGIEPLFAINYERHILDDVLIETHPIFEEIAKKRGFYSEELMEKVAKNNSIQHMDEIPEDVRRIFVTAHDIEPEWHIKMQAAFQKSVDNAVSKTVNFKNSATVDDVKEVYKMAYNLNCKGVTIYRDGSRSEQVLSTSKDEEVEHQHDAKSKRPRPKVTFGTTEKTKIGCGKLYITINSDQYGINELFTTTGKGGGCHAQSEAISRLASLALRSGVAIEEVVEQLRGIRCEAAMIRKDVKNLSCPDAIGRALEKYDQNDINKRFNLNIEVKDENDSKKPQISTDKNSYSNGSACPECGH
ncbi:MAG: LAGLIDADG family homing endonuclease, partial [Bacillota bacterium]